jgi:hypothetical protein
MDILDHLPEQRVEWVSRSHRLLPRVPHAHEMVRPLVLSHSARLSLTTGETCVQQEDDGAVLTDEGRRTAAGARVYWCTGYASNCASLRDPRTAPSVAAALDGGGFVRALPTQQVDAPGCLQRDSNSQYSPDPSSLLARRLTLCVSPQVLAHVRRRRHLRGRPLWRRRAPCMVRPARVEPAASWATHRCAAARPAHAQQEVDHSHRRYAWAHAYTICENIERLSGVRPGALQGMNVGGGPGGDANELLVVSAGKALGITHASTSACFCGDFFTTKQQLTSLCGPIDEAAGGWTEVHESGASTKFEFFAQLVGGALRHGRDEWWAQFETGRLYDFFAAPG